MTGNCLNPCFNGRCTRTKRFGYNVVADEVLILVLMEDALVLVFLLLIATLKRCLNPCFNGRCTRTQRQIWPTFRKSLVLILVLMEDALVQQKKFT